MPFRGKRSNRGSLRKTMKKRSIAKPKVSKVVKTYVKKTIHGNIENKLWIQYGANQTITTAAAGTPTYLSLVPTPARGSEQYQRVGNTIKIVKGYIRGHVNLLPYNAITNPYVGPVMVKMWLCSNKQYNTTLLANTNCSGDFFEGTTTNVGFQGNMLDMELTNNKDDWIVYKTKTFELGTTAVAGFASANSSAWNDNSKFTVPFYFPFGRHIRRKLRYNDGSNVPNNVNMFLIFQVVYADGSSSAVNSAEYHYSSRIEYEDA